MKNFKLSILISLALLIVGSLSGAAELEIPFKHWNSSTVRYSTGGGCPNSIAMSVVGTTAEELSEYSLPMVYEGNWFGWGRDMKNNIQCSYDNPFANQSLMVTPEGMTYEDTPIYTDAGIGEGV